VSTPRISLNKYWCEIENFQTCSFLHLLHCLGLLASLHLTFALKVKKQLDLMFCFKNKYGLKVQGHTYVPLMLKELKIIKLLLIIICGWKASLEKVRKGPLSKNVS
jgi:hypothetical protein